VCRRALRTFEALGCVVEEAAPGFDLESVWQALIRLRGWQNGAALRGYYQDPAQRALLKPEAIFEVETGLRQSAYDVAAASELRTAWSHAVQAFLGRYDFLVLPTAQLFPFDGRERWPQQVAGRPMRSYHEWMKGTLLVTMSGCPALAVPAGFGTAGLPIGMQLIAPLRRDLDCLALAAAYEAAMDPGLRRAPALLQSAPDG
jgi:amidase